MQNQRRGVASFFVGLLVAIGGIGAGQVYGQTFTGLPGVALTNAVINFSALATNPALANPSSNLTSSPPAITFQAMDDDGTQDPPFPGGAVGPNHVVTMLDNTIRIQKRDGTVLATISLQSFWGAVGPYVDPRGAFDPKVLYDPYKGRWITTAVADFQQPTSSTLVGVSQTSDPTGNWNLYRAGAGTNGQFWLNYPSFGFNTNWIAVGVTAYSLTNGPQESQLFVFDKSDLYAGGSGHYTEFTNDQISTFGIVQLPVATYDSTQSNLYMLSEINGNSGGNGEIQVLFINGAVGSEILNVGTEIITPNPWQDNPPTFDFAPQLGSAQLIGLDDSRLSDPIYRNGSIWTAHTIFLPATGTATRSSLQWWQINATDSTILQRGRLDDPTTNLFYGYPSITVNENNDALIGYARFSASNFPSAYFAFRAGTDPTNTLQGEILLKAGEAPFTRSDRWGDHTSTVVDPMNDTDMWTIQEYSATPIKGTSLWGTWWGDVLVGPHVIASNALVVSESCTPTNGVIDPFEHAAVRFFLANIGGADATDVVATLQSTGGVEIPSIAHDFGTLTAGGGVSNQVMSFLADVPCGSNVLATLQLQSGAVDLGNVNFSLPVGVPNIVLTQNFDSVSAPALPSDWSTSGSGVLSGWVTTTSGADTAPNAAFVPDTNDVGSAFLVSPSISITTSNAQLTFRNNYDLETGFDGGVLDIQINGGGFQEITAAGGSFVQGGYTHIISTNAVGTPLAGLPAWSGNSAGWITTIVNLPFAAAGQTVQFRWRLDTDNSGDGSNAGWSVDGVEVDDGGNCCTAGSVVDVGATGSAFPSPVLVGSNLTYTITVTNIGPGIAFGVTVTDVPPSSVTFLSATPSQGGCQTDSLGQVICNLNTITNGESVTVSVAVNAGSIVTLTNVAQIATLSPDANPTNDVAINIDGAVLPSLLGVTPPNQTFPPTATGVTAQVSFTVTNEGVGMLTGTASIGGSPFAIASGSSFTVAGSGSTNVVVSFTPTAPGVFTDEVVFASNGGVSTNQVTATSPPIESFTGAPTAGLVPLTVTFTDTSFGGTITNRFWFFGDGGTTNTPNPTVVYTYNSVGTNTVALQVSGTAGTPPAFSRVNYIIITNIPPLQTVTPGNHDFGLLPVGSSATQTFTVVNAGVATLSGTATVSGAPFTLLSGSPYTVSGGQTGTVAVSFAPASAGAFTGSVVFASNGGLVTNALTGSAAIAPVANFTGSPTNGAATLLVNFTDASSGTVTSRVWTFGDGGTSTLTSPSHSYTNAGSFSVNLTVLGPLGSNALTLSNYITVTNFFGTPVAAFTASPLNGAVPLVVNFTDASTGSITNHSWTFGDGGTSTAISPSHTYSNAGIYSVALTILGPGGSSATNRINLITATNALNTPPTVTILRPASGMLYPPLTNLTITIVADATSNDGAAISKIEFFEDGTEIGETTSNPGTNFLVRPTLGSHVLSARASEQFGTTNISNGTTITIGAKNSPLGDWETTIGGADKGAQFLTFEDDFTASGFGIRLKKFGLDDVSGHWGFNTKGQVTGPFVEETDGTTNWTGTFLGPAKSLKSISGFVPTAEGTFRWKGKLATTFPDLSGTWTGTVTVVSTETAVSYAITNNLNDAAVFDIAASDAPSTVVGQLLVTSRNKVFGYVTFNSKQITMSGSFSASRLSLTLTGKDATAEKVTVKIVK